MPPPADGLTLEARAYMDASAVLAQHLNGLDHLDPSDIIAIGLVARAREHLLMRLKAYLTPSPLPRTEQQAAVLLQQIGQELKAAGAALHQAAATLKQAGIGTPASAARQAGTRALAAAEGLVN